MTLQTAYPEESGIPEQYRELYTRTEDGHWRLTGIDGIRTTEETHALETALIREREEHSSLKKLVESIGKKPEELAAFAAEHEQLLNGLAETREKLASCTEQIRREKIEKSLRKAAAEKGVRSEAVNDVLARASAFDLLEDESVIIRSNGESLSPEQWLEQQLKQAPHWLAPSKSAGAKGFAGTFKHHYSAPASIAEIISDSWNNNKRS